MLGDLLRNVFSPQVGLIPWVGEAAPRSLFAGDNVQYSVQTGHVAQLHPELRLRLPPGQRTIVGAGCSADAFEAFRNAVFEALERYAATVYSDGELVRGAARELETGPFSWRELPELFLREGNGWRRVPFDPDKTIRWVAAHELCSGVPALLPLVLVHIYAEVAEGESFWPQTTSGLAAHTSIEAAVLNGLHELVERDAVESIWLLRPPLREIRIDCSVSAELQSYVREDAAGCIDQRYYDATTDVGVPTVMSVRVLAPPIARDVIVSCASSRDLETAMVKARREAAGQQIMRLHESRGQPYSRFRDEIGHITADALASRPDLGFLTMPGREPISLAEANASTRRHGMSTSEELSALAARISARCGRIYVSNLTLDEHADTGVRVVRVVVPGLMPMSASCDEKFIDHRRLDEVARHFGVVRPSGDALRIHAHLFC